LQTYLNTILTDKLYGRILYLKACKLINTEATSLFFSILKFWRCINLMSLLLYIWLKMWQEMAKYGRKLVEHGLVESNFGNISIRAGDRMLITRSGTALDEITADNVVEVDIRNTSSLDIIASSETVVHREIYRKTSALAIIHAHCLYAVVESLLTGAGKVIVPVDSEGQYFLGDIPVVGGGIGSEELAENLAGALSEHRGAIVFSHGSFAIGRTLAEAYIATTQLEHSCRVKYLYELAAVKS
jgi:L-fuculose-phosphate aldolase